MDGFCSGADTKEGGDQVEGHGVYSGRVGSTPELVELLSTRYREYSDDCALV